MVMDGPANNVREVARQFAGGGALGALILAKDWSDSPLGPIDQWPSALVNAVSLILPAASEIVLFWGAEHVALYNDAYAPTIGDKHPGALGRRARETWGELWDDLAPLLDHVRTTGETFNARNRPFHTDRAGFDEEVFFDVSYSAIRLDDGAIGGVMCIVSETTERVRAERTLTDEKQRLSQLFEDAPGFIVVLRGPDHVIEHANQAFRELIGERPGGIIGRAAHEVLPEIEQQGYWRLLNAVRTAGKPHRENGATALLRRHPDTEPETRHLDFLFHPIRDATGAVSGIFVQGADVTDRYSAERALALSRESLELATEAAEIGIWDIHVRSRRGIWSDRAKAMYGLPPDRELTLDQYYALLHPEDIGMVRTSLAAAVDPARRAPIDIEFRAIRADNGETRWFAATGRGIFENDECVRAAGTVIDISRRRHEREALRESETRFRDLSDSLPALIWQTNEQGEIIFANQFFETFLGVAPAEVIREGWTRLYLPEDRKALGIVRARVHESRAPMGGDLRLMGPNGEPRWVHAEARPRIIDGVYRGFICCAVDVSEAHLAGEASERRVAERTRELFKEIAERERVEATLHQMQRLEAVGQLTSGVAHDFNNLLTVVLGNVAMLERTLGEAGDARTRQRLEHVRMAAERGAALTAQLLAFSRRQRLEAKAVELNASIVGMRPLMESTLGRAITIDARLAPDLWQAFVDPTQFELVVLNLAINARDAMGAAGGKLGVTTANVTLGEPVSPDAPRAGDYVMVSVADTGEGMTEAVRARVFEPFFTTKEVGKGSGLGLAQVYGFVKQSGGGINIETAPGKGTTVTVYLPRAMTDHHPQATESLTTGEVSIAGRTVLVLDDDDHVRAVTAQELRDAGAVVIEAADGMRALSVVERDIALDGAVVDFAMPGMNGAEFAAQARGLRPGLPVLFVTGYADLRALAHVGDDAVIQKPFAAGAISRRLGELISGAWFNGIKPR
ncbi:PAS domain S-box protein [Sphingomonas sp. TX0543]|uniref:hybrid sensor histidine kinase/response regulator n=1 Tax=unclassified Sphingomonas TaxID=196159 RepID=UPI0010F870AA|nr:PAS domain S-box protein [Sphingomonas sp. 3P27F8]